MISSGLRALLSLLAAGYAITGAVLFFAPSWSSGHFAWRVSPFVAMTIGGWFIGTAWACFVVARRGHWAALFCPIVYLGLFGLFEAAVLVLFRDRLLIGNTLAWPYIATLVGTCLFAIAASIEAFRRWPVLAPVGPRFGTPTIVFTLIFVLVVGFLGLYGLTAVEGMRGLNAGIFPEQLSMLSLRAFGSFYLAIAIAAAPLLWARGIGNVLNHGYAMYGLIVFITAAAFTFIGQFNFSGRPTQAIYIGIYLLVGLFVGVYLLRYGTGAKMDQQ